MMDHRQRLETTIAGLTPDRVPVALWRHFPVDDQRPDSLAAAHTDFQKHYDFDLVKVTPESTYMVKGWGVADQWTGNPEGTRVYLERGVRQAQDWARLKRLDPRRGQLGDQLAALGMITKELGPETPVVMTIFSPFGQARKLAGEDAMLSHFRRHPDVFAQGLETITETTIDFISELRQTGVAGIFYAVQLGQYHKFSLSEFETLCLPYHRRILEAAGDFWLNILHLHGREVMFDQVVDLPVQVINWHDRETAPDLKSGQLAFKGAVCGGLRQWDTMVLGTPQQVAAEALEAIDETGGQRFILGTGCVVPITAPHGNLMAARRIVEGL
jgi:uroporphyrinogen decarboxylase